MANLKVFVSSTYYDLHHVRNDLYAFIKDMGYEPVMHDKGGIPYTQEASLEASCYNELSTCDIVICIIGNKYGTESERGNYSITMEELRKAIKSRKKVYTFIVKDVYVENQTYERNKEGGVFKPAYVDDIRIHEFISELKTTVRNSPIQPFEAVSEIETNLKSQFSGLFQKLLSQEATATESKTYSDLQATSDEIKALIESLSKQNEEFFLKFDGTIYATIPTLSSIRNLLGLKDCSFFVKDKTALIELLITMGFKPDCEPPYFLSNDVVLTRERADYKEILELKEGLFGKEDKLKDIRGKELETLLIFKKEDIDNGLPF